MTTPTQHLKIFDEKFVDKFMDLNGNFAYESMKDHEYQDAGEVKRYLIQTVISVLEEQIQEIERHMKNGIKFNHFMEHHMQHGYQKGLQVTLDSLATTLSTWQALL